MTFITVVFLLALDIHSHIPLDYTATAVSIHLQSLHQVVHFAYATHITVTLP